MVLFLKHMIKRTKNGVHIVKSNSTSVEQITGVYEGGSVRTKSGDIWAAKRLPDGNYESVAG